jgi:hypothetical protein
LFSFFKKGVKDKAAVISYATTVEGITSTKLIEDELSNWPS